MAKQQWMLYTKRADFNKIAARFHISPMMARIMVNRDILEEEMEQFLYGVPEQMHSPWKFKGMQKAIEKILQAIQNQNRIRIIGDYDIDGICSSYILYTSLQEIGARVDYDIPDRVKDGYGINIAIIDKAISEKVDMIITCDNGIAAFEPIAYGKEKGLQIIITDHHEVFQENGMDKLPKADVIVNPKQSDCNYPFKSICGAMVTYKLIQALYQIYQKSFLKLRDVKNKDINQREMELLEFVAIATVGDVMKLQNENRIAVKYGLEYLKNTKNLGLKSLIEICGLEIQNLTAYHIGFVIGPCLNASGRLSTAHLAMQMLLEKNSEKAMELAMELKKLNDIRKDKTLQGLEQAITLVEENYLQDSVLVVYLKDCHESLAGIIAGRLREKYQKPSIVLTDTKEGILKGSARSITAYHIFQKLCEVDRLLLKYGGHPMAAGMSLEKANLKELQNQLNQNAKLTEQDFIEKIWIDIALPFSYITEEFIQELERLEPFGQGNEKPSFAQKNVEILYTKIMGKNHNTVKLGLRDHSGVNIIALLFMDGEEFIKMQGDKKYIDILYYPQINMYNGKRSLQIILKGWKF